MISAAYSGVSFFDIGSFKKINFPGYPQRFTPVLILSFLIGLKMIKTNIYYLVPLLIIFAMIFLTYTRSLYIALIASIAYLLLYFLIFKTSPLAKIIYLIATMLITSLAIFGYASLQESENLTVINLIALIDSIYFSFKDLFSTSEYTRSFFQELLSIIDLFLESWSRKNLSISYSWNRLCWSISIWISRIWLCS